MSKIQLLVMVLLPLGLVACSESDLQHCFDGQDNNFNGLVDCADPSCSEFCENDDDDDDDDDTTGDDDVGDDDTSSHGEEGGPEILDLQVSPPTLTEGGEVTFTATVTDPDGTDDIIGGDLTSHGGSVFYGGFAQISSGTFTFTTNWNAINASKPIDFQSGDTWVFQATFTDTSAKEGSKGVELSFTCGGSSACSGECGIDLQTDMDHCGACNDPCNLFSCSNGECKDPYWKYCGIIGNILPTSCDLECSQGNETCMDPWDCAELIGGWPELSGLCPSVFKQENLWEEQLGMQFHCCCY